MPDHGKDEPRGSKGEEIDNRLDAEDVVDIGARLLHGGDAEDVSARTDVEEHAPDDETRERESGHENEMAEMRCA